MIQLICPVFLGAFLLYSRSRAKSQKATTETPFSSYLPWQSGWVGTLLRVLSEHIPIVPGQRARVLTHPLWLLLTANLLPHILSLASTD